MFLSGQIKVAFLWGTFRFTAAAANLKLPIFTYSRPLNDNNFFRRFVLVLFAPFEGSRVFVLLSKIEIN